MNAHDRHLAAYRHHPTDAWCTNQACADYGVAVTVDYEEEYGQGTIRPEECDVCRGDLSLEPPSEPL